MTCCILMGEGSITDAVMEELRGWKDEYFLLCDSPEVLRRCEGLGHAVLIDRNDEDHFIRRMQREKVTSVSFVGYFSSHKLISQNTSATLKRNRGGANPAALLDHVVDSLHSISVEIVPISSLFDTFAPTAGHKRNGRVEKMTSEVFGTAKRALSQHKDRIVYGWASSCLVSANGATILPQLDEKTDEFVRRVAGAETLDNHMFLCRYSPWHHSQIMRPTIGVGTIETCISKNISGILADRSQTVLVRAPEVQMFAEQENFHLEFF